MNLLKYRKLKPHEIKNVLNEYIDLTDYQKEQLSEINHYPFEIIKYEEPKTVNLLWRLTVFFYLMFVIYLYLAIPIKWLFTGNIYYSTNSSIYKFFAKWHKKLGFKI